MENDLQELIDEVKAATESHVVVFFSKSGIHWRALSESACKLVAQVLIVRDCSVLTREAFIQILEQQVLEEKAVEKQ